MEHYIHETPAPSQNPPEELGFDVVVVGGGMSGLCAAVASAREGAKTVLVQDRSVFGGNASSEMRMHISGASCHWGKKNASETGILMELQLENKYLNDSYNYSIWDGVLWNAAKETENLTIFMNTAMNRVVSDGTEILGVECYQTTTEKSFFLTGRIYIDCTGNGTLGYFAGAEYAIGRESRSTFNEKDAPDTCDGETMGNTIYFVAEDVGHPVKFVKPSWAYTFDESDFKHRYHGDIVVYHDADDVVVLKPGEDYADHADQLVEKYDVKSGYWWIELGGDWKDILGQAEEIRWELYKTVYGVWDHIKNGGDHGAQNYELKWVGNLPGTRESRRLYGNHILTEQEILANTRFEDAVAYGGWPMDEHVAGGFAAKDTIPSRVRSFPGLYTIPYGCYCSKTISNMMMAGKTISCSKLAMGSTRVMGTCAIGGEAAGTAAAMACRLGMRPKEFGETHMKELQQELLKNDCYIPGIVNNDPKDFARTASVSASSEKNGFPANNVTNGISRDEEDSINLWCSEGVADTGEKLTLNWSAPVTVSQIRLTFDPDLSEERCISVSKAFLEKEPKGVPVTLVKEYSLTAFCQGKEIWKQTVYENHQRLNVISLPETVQADCIEIRFTATNGCTDIRVFEVRVY